MNTFLSQSELTKKYLPDLIAHRGEVDKIESLFFVKASGGMTSYHFKEIYSEAVKYAWKLRQLGVKKGDTVCLILPTCVEFFYCFFGSQLIGAIPYSIYPPLNLGKIDEWQNHTEKLLSIVNTKIVLATNQIQKILFTPVKNAKVPLGVHSIKDFVDDQPKEITPDFHKLAFLQYSSGSTGTPKPVAISHHAAIENAYQIAKQHERATSKKPVAVSWLPLYHDMGLVGMCFAPIIGDATLYFLRPDHFIGNPLLWIKTMSDVKATVTVAPNFAYGLCARRIDEKDLDGIDLSHLALSGCGAEMILPSTTEQFFSKFQNYGFKPQTFTPCYGLAEATLAVTFAHPKELIKFESFDQMKLQEMGWAEPSPQGVNLLSVGPPIDDVTVEIRSENGEKLPHQSVGEIWIKSPSLLTEYFNQPEATKNTLEDGWLNSGDLGFLKKGELFIVGRRKEVIILNGSNVDPSFIEQATLTLEEVRSGCVVAFSAVAPQGKQDTESLIVVVESKNESLHEDDKIAIKERVKKEVFKKTKYNVDHVIVLTPRSIPRTSSGKIKRSETKNMWLKQQLTNHSSSKARRFYKVLKAMIKGKLDSR